MKNKYNYILIFKDGDVPDLPESKRKIEIHKSQQDWKAAIGSWDKEQIKNFDEYYKCSCDWQTKSGWKDRPL